MEDFIISGCLFSILFIFSFRNIHVLMQNYKKLFDFYYRKDKKVCSCELMKQKNSLLMHVPAKLPIFIAVAI